MYKKVNKIKKFKERNLSAIISPKTVSGFSSQNHSFGYKHFDTKTLHLVSTTVPYYGLTSVFS